MVTGKRFTACNSSFFLHPLTQKPLCHQIYIAALPVWNFILPIYSFWHFDDFTWGATRRVHGDKANEGHTEDDGDFDSSQVIMRKWEEWEALRWGRRKGPIRMTLITPSNASTMEESKRPTPVSPLSPTFLDRQKFGSSSPAASVRTSNEKDRRRRSMPVYMTPTLNRSREFRPPTSGQAVDFQAYRMSTDFSTAKQGALKSEGYFGPQSMVSLAPQAQDTESSSVTVGSLSIYSRRPSEATNASGFGSEGASNENDHYSGEEWTSEVASTLQQVLQKHR
jgi:Chitin synthase